MLMPWYQNVYISEDRYVSGCNGQAMQINKNQILHVTYLSLNSIEVLRYADFPMDINLIMYLIMLWIL